MLNSHPNRPRCVGDCGDVLRKVVPIHALDLIRARLVQIGTASNGFTSLAFCSCALSRALMAHVLVAGCDKALFFKHLRQLFLVGEGPMRLLNHITPVADSPRQMYTQGIRRRHDCEAQKQPNECAVRTAHSYFSRALRARHDACSLGTAQAQVSFNPHVVASLGVPPQNNSCKGTAWRRDWHEAVFVLRGRNAGAIVLLCQSTCNNSTIQRLSTAWWKYASSTPRAFRAAVQQSRCSPLSGRMWTHGRHVTVLGVLFTLFFARTDAVEVCGHDRYAL